MNLLPALHTFRVPVMLYGFTMFAAALSFNLMLQHAVRAKLFHPSHSEESLHRSIKRGMLGPVIYLISIVAALLTVYISLVIFILVPVFYFIPQKIERLRDK